jgi:hypothetical protein
MMRVPGILAGLNDRSQSAYAAPSPKPVDSPMGHVRPVREQKEVVRVWQAGDRENYGRRKRMTEAMTPTLKPTPL